MKLLDAKRVYWERLILLCFLFILGSALTLGIPHFSKPDEPVHFERAIEVANGKFFCFQNKEFKTNYDYSYLYTTANRFKLAGSPTTIPLSVYKVPLFYEKSTHQITKKVKYCNFLFLGYTLNAFGIFIGETLSLHPLIIFFLGRYINFLTLFSILAYFLYKEKRHFWLIFIPLSFPQTLHQLGAYSYDGILITSGLLVSLLFLKKYSKRNFLLISALSLIAFLTKFTAYFIFLFIPLLYLLKERKLKTRKIIILFPLFIIFSLPIFLRIIGSSTYSYLGPKNPLLQLKILVDNPTYGMEILINTLREKQGFFINSTIGNLEWLGFKIEEILYFVFFSFITLLTYIYTKKLKFNKKNSFIWILILTITTLQLLAISFGMYLTWTNLGDDVIEGVQGRYFLPILPFIVLSFTYIFKLLINKKLLHITTFSFISLIVVLNIYERHFDYSKALEFNKIFIPGKEVYVFDEKKAFLEQQTKILQNRKLAALEIYIEKKSNKKTKEKNLSHPPLYFDIKDNACKKRLQRKIIPANTLSYGFNTIFIKVIKTRNKYNSLCITLSTPAKKFKQKLKLRKVKEKNSKEQYIFYPRYLW